MIYDGYRDETIIFRRVTWPGLLEAEDYGMFTGGSLELSAFSDLRASGSLAFCGRSVPDAHDLIRIYYRFVDEAGKTYEAALGTFFFAVSNPVHIGGMVTGEASLESMLRVAMKGKYGRHYTVSAGTNAVAKAVSIIEGLGVKTNKPSSAYVLSRDMVFDPDDSWLKIANQLLSAAGYSACWPDSYGIVQMAPYVEPQERDPVWTFSDGDRSIMLPEVSVSDNSEDIPNVVKLTYETEEESLWACAYNDDPNSRASRPFRGYEVTLVDTVDELAGATKSERLAQLESHAASMLVENSAGIEYVEWGHPWVPLIPNDAMQIVYSQADMEWKGAVTNMQMELDGHVEVSSKARRFVHKGFEIWTEGGSW